MEKCLSNTFLKSLNRTRLATCLHSQYLSSASCALAGASPISLQTRVISIFSSYCRQKANMPFSPQIVFNANFLSLLHEIMWLFNVNLNWRSHLGCVEANKYYILYIFVSLYSVFYFLQETVCCHGPQQGRYKKKQIDISHISRTKCMNLWWGFLYLKDANIKCIKLKGLVTLMFFFRSGNV